MNSMSVICITWDMDKIIYSCSAEHIGFSFPKRKWWDFSNSPREARFSLVEKFTDEEVGILMRIYENIEAKESDCGAWGYEVTIPPVYRDEIWQEFIKCSKKRKRYDTLLVVDYPGSSFSEFLIKSVDDVNYLAVLTQEPDSYEYVLAEIVQEYGLAGMIFTQNRDFVQYQRTFCRNRNVLIFMGEGCFSRNDDRRNVFFKFPEGSLVLDFDIVSDRQKTFCGKRMGNAYVSMSIFLDNIVKNRYNSVVNEGLQSGVIQIYRLQQNVSRADDKNKLSEKRKGIRKWKKRRIF